MRDGEECAEYDAEPSDDYVCDAKERVLAADDSAGGDDEGLLAAVFGYVEVYGWLVLLALWKERFGLTVIDENIVGARHHSLGVVPLC
jgi:hypothetical protein